MAYTNNKYERRALQDPLELAHFIKLLKGEKISSYLEIGCKFGGSLWQVATILPKGARIVAVDLPHGDGSFKESQPPLEECVKRLREALKFDAHLFLGDSTDPEIIAKVAALGPFDACLIDANHTEPFVRADWANYGPLARIVAFHDIGWDAQGREHKMGKLPIQVPIIWNELKPQFRHQEIKLCTTKRDNGFGVLWRC
jgi:cephalosporin hydroxylase